MVPTLAARIKSYRAETFRLAPNKRVKSRQEAVDFVNQRGYVYFWPIKGILLPSLWQTVAGDRPVPNEHDDPGHVTWGWKDELVGSRQWYYAKVLRKRATMIAFDKAPYFYALSENYGSPEEDYLTLYEQGRMTQESKVIYETLLIEGPLDTIALKRATRLTSRESESRFNKSITELQADFKIVPVGVTTAGAWRYAFAYDLVHRHYPDIPERARSIGDKQARVHLLEMYFLSVGAAQRSDLLKLFGWRPLATLSATETLVQSEFLREGLQIEGSKGEWFVLSKIATM